MIEISESDREAIADAYHDMGIACKRTAERLRNNETNTLWHLGYDIQTPDKKYQLVLRITEVDDD